MAYSVSFSLACICIVLCSTYPASVFSKPARISAVEQSEKELKKFDLTTLAMEESPSEETKETERPPDNSKKAKHMDSTKLAEQENEGTTENLVKKSLKSKVHASATLEKDTREKSKVQKKKSESTESTSEDFAEYQHSTAHDVGFESLFSKDSSDEATQVFNGDGEASNKGESEKEAAEDNRTPVKEEDKPSKREKLADDPAEVLPSAERQRGKMPDTTQSPITTSVPAVPTTGSSASINIPRASCSFALALVAVLAVL